MLSSFALHVSLVLALLLGAPSALAATSPHLSPPLASPAGVTGPTVEPATAEQGQSVPTPTQEVPAADSGPTPADAAPAETLERAPDDAVAEAPVTETLPEAANSASAVSVSFQNGVSPSSSYSGGDDTYLSQSATASNFGAAPSCMADGDDPAGSGRDLSCLLRWDLSSIPPGSTVTSASIILNVINNSANSYPIYQVLQPWGEAQASWQSYASGLSWNVAGALGSLDRGSTALGALSAPATGLRTFSLNAAGISVVQSWVNTPTSNRGIIVADANMTDGVDFSSNESGAASQRPKLTVQYVPGGAPTATSPAPTPTSVPSATPTGTSTPVATATSTPTRTSTPVPTATATPTAIPPTPAGNCSLIGQPASGPYCFGILGSDSTRNSSEYGARIRYKLFTIRWAQFSPSEGAIDASYVSRKQSELASLRQAGLTPILSLGIHDPPDWLHTNYPNSYYVDQYGDQYTDGLDTGDVNLIFNPTMRSLAATYIGNLFAAFGTNFAAVRLGGGRYGELTYPPASYGGKSNLYWDFDANALARSPVPAWRPGSASPKGEGRTFLRWHLDALTEFQNWQISVLRQKGYQGPLMMLYPSWGMRPGDFDKAVATNLNGSSSAEKNGEIQRGFDFQSQIAAIGDPTVIVTSTWMDADASGDSGTDQRYWSPVHYLASLAHAHPLGLSAFGENTGHGARAKMDLSASRMKQYRLTGMMWYNETELFSGSYATLADYQQVISAYNP